MIAFNNIRPANPPFSPRLGRVNGHIKLASRRERRGDDRLMLMSERPCGVWRGRHVWLVALFGSERGGGGN